MFGDVGKVDGSVGLVLEGVGGSESGGDLSDVDVEGGDLGGLPSFEEAFVGLLGFALLEEGLGGEEEGLGEIEETLLSSEGFGGFAEEAEGGFVVGGEEVEFGFFEEVAGVEIAGGFASGVGASGLEVSIGVGPSAIDASEMRADEVG